LNLYCCTYKENDILCTQNRKAGEQILMNGIIYLKVPKNWWQIICQMEKYKGLTLIKLLYFKYIIYSHYKNHRYMGNKSFLNSGNISSWTCGLSGLARPHLCRYQGWTDTLDGGCSFREESWVGRSSDTWLKDCVCAFSCQLPVSSYCQHYRTQCGHIWRITGHPGRAVCDVLIYRGIGSQSFRLSQVHVSLSWLVLSLFFRYRYSGPALRLLRPWARSGQTFADQELLLIFTESRGPPRIVTFLVVYGKPQEIYNNNKKKIRM
jgi:hypothetical protein